MERRPTPRQATSIGTAVTDDDLLFSDARRALDVALARFRRAQRELAEAQEAYADLVRRGPDEVT